MAGITERVVVAVRPPEQPLALRKTPRSAAGSNMYRVVSVAPQTAAAQKKEMSEQSPKQETSAASAAEEESPKKTSETAKEVSKRKRSLTSTPVRKRHRGNGEGDRTDNYCWICHKECNMLTCEVCPRAYHLKCVTLEAEPDKEWVCPECDQIMRAENMDMRSSAMQTLSIDQLCDLLKFALARMKHQCAEEFLRPVSLEAFPNYTEYICHPMDLETLEKNIRKKLYGCTESFLADAKWIVHNCIIFNGYHNRLTSLSKSLFKICKHEMSEIEVCPDCYHNAYSKKDNWFIEPCCPPHLLIWAKLKGFPFWPAKAMRVVGENVDVRFFGAHDRSWIPVSSCFLLSKDAPTGVKMKKKGMFEQSMTELDSHIKKLRDMFHNFGYAPLRKCLSAGDLKADVQDMLPGVNLKNYRRSAIGRIGLHNKGPRSFSTDGRGGLGAGAQKSVGNLTEARVNLVQIKVERFDYIPASDGLSSGPPTAKPTIRTRRPESGGRLEATIEKLKGKGRESGESGNSLAGSESGSLAGSSGPLPMNVCPEGDDEDTRFPRSPAQDEEEEEEPTENDAADEGDDAPPRTAGEPCEVSSTTCVTDEPATTSARAAVRKGSTDSPAKETTPAKDAEEIPPGETVPVVAELAGEEDSAALPIVVRKVTLSVDDAAKAGSTVRAVVCKVPLPSAVDDVRIAHQGKKSKKASGTAELGAGTRDDEAPLTSEPNLLGGEDKLSAGDEDAVSPPRSTIDGGDSLDCNDGSLDAMEVDVAAPASRDEDVVKFGSAQEMTSALVTTLMGDPAKTTREGADDNSLESFAKRTSEAEESGSQGEDGELVIDLDRAPRVRVVHKVVKVVKKAAGKAPVSVVRLKEVKDSEVLAATPPPRTYSVALNAALQADAATASATTAAPASLPVLAPMGVPSQRLNHPQVLPRSMPALQCRPSIVNSAASTSSPATSQDNLCKYSKKMAEFVKGTLEEMFSDLAKSGNPQATIKTLQLEMEKMQWRHQQELSEMKHNNALVLLETRNSMEADKERTINEIRRQCEQDKQKAVEDTKRKLWCANCSKEAIFYCCWNTSYCDYPCQQAHWPSHVNTCTQANSAASRSRTGDGEGRGDDSRSPSRKSGVSLIKGRQQPMKPVFFNSAGVQMQPKALQPHRLTSAMGSPPTRVTVRQLGQGPSPSPGSTTFQPRTAVQQQQQQQQQQQRKPVANQIPQNVQLYFPPNVRIPHSLTVVRGTQPSQQQRRSYY